MALIKTFRRDSRIRLSGFSNNIRCDRRSSNISTAVNNIWNISLWDI